MYQLILVWLLGALFISFCPEVLTFSTHLGLSLRNSARNLHRTKCVKNTPYSFKLKSQSPEDIKINSQIARLNAVAAKLRAEAADLEAEQRKALSDNLDFAFREFDDNSNGMVSVPELKDGLANILAESLNEDQALRVMKTFDAVTDEKGIMSNEIRSAEAFRNKLYRLLQDEKDAAFLAKREATIAKLAAEKAEAIAELVNNRAPTGLDRLVGGLPYLLPLLDAFPYGAHLVKQLDLQSNPVHTALSGLYSFYRSVPFAGLAAFFSVIMLSNSLRLNRLVRFNLHQAILLDVALIVPGLLSRLLSLANKHLGIEVPEEFATGASSTLFVTLFGVFLYGVSRSLSGSEAGGLPFVSHYVTQRVPTHKEFLSMFDEEGNFRPLPAVTHGEVISSAYRTSARTAVQTGPSSHTDQSAATTSDTQVAQQTESVSVVSDEEKEARIMRKEQVKIAKAKYDQ